MFGSLMPICTSQQTSCELFFILSPSNGLPKFYRKVNLDPLAQKDLTEIFKKKVFEEIINKTNGLPSLSLVSSLSSKGNDIYEYDISNQVTEFGLIEDISKLTVSSNPTIFNFSKDEISEIRGLVLRLSDGNDSIYIYQHTYQVSLHKKSRFSFMKSTTGNVLEGVDRDMLDIRKDFDFFFYQGKHYIINLNLLEREYGLNAIIDNMVNLAIPNIISMNVINMTGVVNQNSFFDEIKSNRTYMKKLAKIHNSGLPAVTIPQIQTILNDFPKFGRELSINNNLLDLNSKRRKMFFIRLLNDEAVRSALTNSVYLADDRESAV
ncbi:DUF4868 domain-containing protein [Pantoea brenneri]|uniref:Kiwa anti-phage protein KwaB-like domain-containing protein n=1 Tax=Pantoea brenneri TaxID=472694 RepID=UPI00210DD5D5|nr:Kiwa anti-phage protein KwaB-like domain-containing protein [Pantoea brenneri]MCQ5473238.1 DUF4868 domain-containing protein [Pantoea brenneri]